MRAISSSIMAALVVVALFWGNCFSCPQALLTLKTHQPAHQCCHKNKTSAPGCESQNLQQFVKADPGTTAPAVAALGVIAPAGAPTVRSEVAPSAAPYSPPDLLTLQSILRV
jgi:hypothetical protein